MSLSLQTLLDLRDALIRARARGVREVTDQNGERVRFADDSDMARAIADLESRIAATQQAAPNVIRFQTSKGT